MHIKQTHIPNAHPILFKEHVSPTHDLTVRKNNETPTFCKLNGKENIKYQGL